MRRERGDSGIWRTRGGGRKIYERGASRPRPEGHVRPCMVTITAGGGGGGGQADRIDHGVDKFALPRAQSLGAGASKVSLHFAGMCGEGVLPPAKCAEGPNGQEAWLSCSPHPGRWALRRSGTSFHLGFPGSVGRASFSSKGGREVGRRQVANEGQEECWNASQPQVGVAWEDGKRRTVWWTGFGKSSRTGGAPRGARSVSDWWILGIS